MAEFPALPLFTDAYLGDTTHLTTIEHGAYLLLLMAAWRSKEVRLPDNNLLLSRYAKLTAGQWARIRPIIVNFFVVKDGFWYQGRLTDEAKHVRQHSKRQSENAKGRWLKSNETPDAMALPRDSHGNAPTPTPTPTPTIKKDITPHPFEEFWQAYPRKIGKAHAQKAYLTALKEITHESLVDHSRKLADAHRAANTEQKFIPHPATWLNGRRWEDDLSAIGAGGRASNGRPQPRQSQMDVQLDAAYQVGKEYAEALEREK